MPELPADSTMSPHELLATKRGIPREQVELMHDQVTARAAELGLDYRFDRALTTNTASAHRLSHFAAALSAVFPEAERREFPAADHDAMRGAIRWLIWGLLLGVLGVVIVWSGAGLFGWTQPPLLGAAIGALTSRLRPRSAGEQANISRLRGAMDAGARDLRRGNEANRRQILSGSRRAPVRRAAAAVVLMERSAAEKARPPPWRKGSAARRCWQNA